MKKHKSSKARKSDKIEIKSKKDEEENGNLIYTPIEPEIYKASKINLLNSQASILSSAKHLENLQKIRGEKAELKEEFKKMLSRTLFYFRAFKNALPEIHNKQAARINFSKKIEITKEVTTTKTIITAHSSIDAELAQIQRKLRSLNY